jgi:methyl-accepting chemotaxis protein
MPILAQIQPVPMPNLAFAVGCVIALVALYVLIVTAIRVTKDTFGKQPPLHDQISQMRKEFAHEMARHEAEITQHIREHDTEDAEEFQRLEEKIEAVDHDVRQFRKEVSDNGDRRKTEMLQHIDVKCAGISLEIRKNQDATQEQLNNIHESIGEFRGELKRRND